MSAGPERECRVDLELQFLEELLRLGGVEVGRGDGQITVTRPLTDDPTSMSDVCSLVREYGLPIEDSVADVERGYLRLVIGAGGGE